MKALARSYLWWPKLDQDVKRLVKTCCTCQEHKNVPAVAPLHPWNWINRINHGNDCMWIMQDRLRKKKSLS